MTADQLIQYLTWAVYGLIFVAVVVRAVLQPRRVNLDIALFFSAPTLIIAISLAAAADLIQPGPIPNAINASLLMAMVYALIRLVGAFSDQAAWLRHSAGVLFVLLSLGAFVFSPPRPGWLTLLQLLYVIGLFLYATIAFLRQSRRSGGVTRRRLVSVAWGCGFLVLTFSSLGLAIALPQFASDLSLLADSFSLVASICYYLGFAPPRFLRRAWQEPELRAFLGRAASLPRLPDTAAIVAELERGAATAIGAPRASIGRWHEDSELLHFAIDGQIAKRSPHDDFPVSQSFLQQQALFVPDVERAYPASATTSRNYGVSALLAAPITASERKLGVLTVYSPYASIFADDDLALVQLLADQAAVILESRALIDEAARVQAREEATRLKDDFLSAAAHDLKTPLTTLLVKAQQLERKARRNPTAAADISGLQLLVQEAQRLRRLVLELLDASRAEQGQLVGARSPVDLVATARGVSARWQSAQHSCVVEARGSIMGMYDQLRIEQLIENLADNAVKYSPAGGTVSLTLWSDGDLAHLTVRDHGIGIPPGDLPHIFERFYRAGNVDDRRFAGMGLGLFICQAIVEQHGGQIVVSSTPGEGTTMHVSLPLNAAVEVVYA